MSDYSAVAAAMAKFEGYGQEGTLATINNNFFLWQAGLRESDASLDSLQKT